VPDQNLENLFRAFQGTTSSNDVKSILEEYGDRPEIGVDQKFGELGLMWHPYGDNVSNISTIGLARDPGRSLIERITNAFDAVLDERFDPSFSSPSNPRVAAKNWFGRPMSGPDDGLFKWRYADYGYDRRVHVVISSSDSEYAPTIDVVDDGIGIRPEDFPTTILSLQSGNKIRKPHLIGAFGQGGSSTLGFCDYVLIVSRPKGSVHSVGFTLIRVLRLDETYKEDAYAYLCLQGPSEKLQVPTLNRDDSQLDLYPTTGSVKLPALRQGTLVRHYSYRIPKLQGSLAPAPGNLYHYLHYFLFDPLFPFRLIDIREPATARDERVSGSRNRLMRLVQKADVEGGEEERGSQIRHHRPMEYVVPYGAIEPCVGIEYWVVLNYRKGPADRGGILILRGDSNELYVQKGHPVAASVNGQTQGELTARILQPLGLSMIARHIVIHMDATGVSKDIRRELFATTREGFKEGRVLESLLKVLEQMLAEDKVLLEIEAELTSKLATREAQGTKDEVRRQVTKLLLEAGFRVSEVGKGLGPGDTEAIPVPPKRTGRPLSFDPLPTLPFPQVTKFSIVTPKPKMNIPTNDVQVVLVETDADAEFDRQGRIALRCEPDSLELAAKSPLRGGRMRWRLRPRETAQPGTAGKIVVTLTEPDGTQLADSTYFEVLPAHEERVKVEKTLIPPFEIFPIDPFGNPEKWSIVWPDVPPDAEEKILRSVAYKPVPVKDGVNVYYSTIFGPFKDAIDRTQRDAPAMLELFTNNYEVWIGYHAILQHNERPNNAFDIDESTIDRILEDDRTRVARLQVKEAAQNAELALRLIRETKAE